MAKTLTARIHMFSVITSYLKKLSVTAARAARLRVARGFRVPRVVRVRVVTRLQRGVRAALDARETVLVRGEHLGGVSSTRQCDAICGALPSKVSGV